MAGKGNSPAKVLLYGAGSIGGVYLYQLLQAGCHVTAVCRSNYGMVKDRGFSLTSVRYGSVEYRPSAIVRDVSECYGETFEFILVCTKYFPDSMAAMFDHLKPILDGSPETAIILAQNGVGIEEPVRKAFPQNPIISGVVYCPAVQTGPGTIDYPEMLNLLELGTYPSKPEAEQSHQTAAIRFADLMIQGGGNAEVHDDIQIARWSKLLMNGAWNPIGALTLTTDGDFLNSSDPYAHDLGWGVMMEIVSLAKAVGVPDVTVEVATKKFSISQKRAENGTGREMSMLQDIRQNRMFEVEAILGNPLRLAKQHGVPVPRLETLYALGKARLWALVQMQRLSRQNSN